MHSRMKKDLKDSYGLTCDQITPVTGGYLNLKWKISTEKGDLLVKQFNNMRFNTDRLKRIELALQRQIILEKKGVLCPRIWQCDGRAIRLLDDGTAYMVMEFRSGKVESSDSITIKQMQSLGNACAFMHKAFSNVPALEVVGFPIANSQVIDALWLNFRDRVQESSSSGLIEYRKAVLAQGPILNQLTIAFFDKLPKGIAHEDFANDNMLFDEDGLSAIVDFDRNHYSYIWHDIGRAILSFALKENRLDNERINAFIKGYSQHLTLTLPNVVDALRLSWCMEIPWWIQPEFFGECSPKVTRFKDEMLWLTKHWFELDSLLGTNDSYAK